MDAVASLKVSISSLDAFVPANYIDKVDKFAVAGIVGSKTIMCITKSHDILLEFTNKRLSKCTRLHGGSKIRDIQILLAVNCCWHVALLDQNSTCVVFASYEEEKGFDQVWQSKEPVSRMQVKGGSELWVHYSSGRETSLQLGGGSSSTRVDVNVEVHQSLIKHCRFVTDALEEAEKQCRVYQDLIGAASRNLSLDTQLVQEVDLIKNVIEPDHLDLSDAVPPTESSTAPFKVVNCGAFCFAEDCCTIIVHYQLENVTVPMSSITFLLGNTFFRGTFQVTTVAGSTKRYLDHMRRRKVENVVEDRLCIFVKMQKCSNLSVVKGMIQQCDNNVHKLPDVSLLNRLDLLQQDEHQLLAHMALSSMKSVLVKAHFGLACCDVGKLLVQCFSFEEKQGIYYYATTNSEERLKGVVVAVQARSPFEVRLDIFYPRKCALNVFVQQLYNHLEPHIKVETLASSSAKNYKLAKQQLTTELASILDMMSSTDKRSKVSKEMYVMDSELLSNGQRDTDGLF